MSEREESNSSLEEEDSDQDLLLQFDRVYQRSAIEDEIYYVPIDEPEPSRLRIQHEVVTKFLQDQLIHPRLSSDPKRVLDCGYGQGDWVVEVARKFPDCKVTGIDFHDVDIPNLPDNVELINEDLNSRLTEFLPLDSFDLIQSRFVSNCIRKDHWAAYTLELVHLLKPGGWLQMIDYYYNFQSHTGILDRSYALWQWGEKFREAAGKLNRCTRIGNMLGSPNMKDLLERARFQNIYSRNCSIPIGGWSTNAREREVGIQNRSNVEKMLDSLGTWPFCSVLGMSTEEVSQLNSRAKMELRDNTLKLYLPAMLAFGQRPIDE